MLMMPLAAGLAKSLGKRIGKAVGQAGEASGVLVTFLSEMFKGSRMIRIYQRENQVRSEANEVINDVIKKNVKTSSILIRAAPLMETLTGIMIAGFIAFSGKLIAAGELEVNNFFSFLAAMMMAYQPIRSLATLNMIFYQGEKFPELNNKVLVTSLKAQKLISLDYKNDKVINEQVLYEREGRMRDVEFNSKGEIFIIIDDSKSGIWKLIRK